MDILNKNALREGLVPVEKLLSATPRRDVEQTAIDTRGIEEGADGASDLFSVEPVA